MANELDTDIIRILTQARDEIRAAMEAKNINASGRTSASIHVDAYDGGYRLVGGNDATHPVDDYPKILGTLDAYDTAPIPTLEVGRAGGSVPKGFYYLIRQWSREKGLQFSSESERGTFAYFVARKIARQGTLRAEKNVDVYSTPVENAKAALRDVIRQSIGQTVRAAIGGEAVSGLKGAFTR